MLFNLDTPILTMSEEKVYREMSKYELKKLLDELEDVRGRNTELVSLYIPAGYNMAKIKEFVTKEQSEAENIKSKSTRKNVKSALDRLGRKVSESMETPENGVVLFCGNVSEREGRPDIQLWEVIPPEPVESRHYRCDKEFMLEPLREMVVDDRVYGLIVADKNEAAVGYLQGSTVKTAYTLDSEVPGKTRAGGQCLSPDTLVQTSSGDNKEIREIEPGDVVKCLNTETRKLQDTEVVDKWENRKEIYSVKTKHPSLEVEASADHEMFVSHQDVHQKPVSELEEGDKLLFPEEMRTADLEPSLSVDKLYNSYKISGEGREQIRDKRQRQGLSQKQLGRLTDKTQTAVSKLEKGERDIKRDFLLNILSSLEIDFEDFRTNVQGKGVCLPSQLSTELAKLLGYFAGDGHREKTRLSFFEENRKVAEQYETLLQTVFRCETSTKFREDKNYYRIRAQGKPLSRLLKSEFPRIRKSHNTRIPRKITQAKDNVLAGFLRGLYDAEGHASASRARVGISANNQQLMRETQLGLLRLGIISSLYSYDNSENPYSENTRYTVSISDQKSLEKFHNKIGFTCEEKAKELEQIVQENKNRQKNRQVLRSGIKVRQTIEEQGHSMEDFKEANTYLQGDRNIGDNAFKRNLVDEAQEPLKTKLSMELEEPDVRPTQVKSIQKVGPSKTIDISTGAGNFIANGLVVHNSAQRFARIRENMYDQFMKEIADKAKNAFLQKARDGDLLGIVVGGPGFTKDKLVDNDYLQSELDEKVLGKRSLNYSGEEALEELVSKSEEMIQDSRMIREKNLVSEFLENLREESGKAEYGPGQVWEALGMGAVDTVLVSESMELFHAVYEDDSGEERHVFEEEAEIDESNENLTHLGDLVEDIASKAEEMSTDFEIVSTRHEEGQRLENLGGVAAILRYRIR